VSGGRKGYEEWLEAEKTLGLELFSRQINKTYANLVDSKISQFFIDSHRNEERKRESEERCAFCLT